MTETQSNTFFENRTIYFPILGVLLVVALRTLSAVLLPLIPPDAVLNAGPALGLFWEGRLVDPLAYTQYRSYMGFPPVYMVFEAAWFKIFGLGLWSWFSFLMFNLILLGVSLILLARRYSSSPMRIFLVVLIILSSGYCSMGRVDTLATVFISGSLFSILSILNRPSHRGAVGVGLWLAAAALTHPVAGWVGAIGTMLMLLWRFELVKLKMLIIAGVIALGVVLGVYVPIVLSDIATWKQQFIGHILHSRAYFVIGALTKFWTLNGGFLLLLAAICLRIGLVSLVHSQATQALMIAVILHLAILPFGASYYALYAMPYWMVALLELWNVVDLKENAHGVRSWLEKKGVQFGVVLAMGIALFIGPGVSILQACLHPGYKTALLTARQVLKEKAQPGEPVLVDYDLLPAVIDRPRVRLLWHTWYINRMDNLLSGTLIATTNELYWKKQQIQRIIGRWDDPQNYEVVALLPQTRGLPRIFHSGEGPAMGLILVRKKTNSSTGELGY